MEEELRRIAMGLFDDVLKNINQGINDIQNKSQEMMQGVTINARIRSLEQQRSTLLLNIGQLVFDKYEKGDEVSEELLRDKVKQISDIDKDIDLANAELKNLKLEPDAPKSQKAAHQAGYKPTPGFTCPHCGSPANSGKFYCVSCGGSLKEGATAATGSGNPSQQNFNPGGNGTEAPNG
jgi:hypothetical protein